jgi:hypothetical protein
VAADVAQTIREAAEEIANAAREAGGEAASTRSAGNMIVIKRSNGTEIMLQNVDVSELSALAEAAPPPQEGGPSARELAGMMAGFGLAFALLYPLVKAVASRLHRPTAVPKTAASPDADQRLNRIESTIESVALEVERISEGQRFTTKLLSERSSLAPAPTFSAQPAEAVPIGRHP